MRTTKTVIGVTVAALLVLLAASAWSQPEGPLEVDAFGVMQRPAVAFMHDAHNEKAELEECSVCHHVFENGKKVEGEDSIGQACADCHGLKAKGAQPGLRAAFHGQCKSCHETKAKGPLACGQCHER